MRAAPLWIALASSGAVACHSAVDSGGDESSGGTFGTVDSTSGADSSATSTGGDDGERIEIPVNRDAAILFVVDNSSSMGPAQGRLAAAANAFWDPLAHAGAGLRIAFTTTDNGNPACAGTQPESGAFVASSCRARIDEFTLDMPPINAAAQACNDACALPQLALAPSATGRDPTPKLRPWLEWGAGDNLPDGVTLADAFACAAPQGIAGCGFESPLESMYRALLRNDTADDAAYGFLEEAAVLAIVLVSDETDCSYAEEWGSIFLPADQGGDPSVFWSDPDAAAPTSAVCWHAGVVCTGGPAVYDECHSVDKDVAGNSGAAEADAVLYPIARYVDQLQAIEEVKAAITPNQEVVVAAIAGVPPGYESGAVEIDWLGPEDPIQADEYGIAPGCTNVGTGVYAIPPVREREVVEALEIGGQRAIYSACENDYGAALGAIANRIVDQLSISCATMCVADADPDAFGLQPECTVVRETPADGGGTVEVEIPPCNGDEVPNGEDVCWLARVDTQEYTERLWDDMSPECSDAGWNLELHLERREGVPTPPGSTVSFSCTPSPDARVDCPDLP